MLYIYTHSISVPTYFSATHCLTVLNVIVFLDNLKQAIEGFALTVKEIAQMLQAFGTELAETELPGDIYSIEHILANRTEKYCQLKVCLIGFYEDRLLQHLKEQHFILYNAQFLGNI